MNVLVETEELEDVFTNTVAVYLTSGPVSSIQIEKRYLSPGWRARQEVEWNPVEDSVTICGIRYSMSIFRLWGDSGVPEGRLFMIKKDDEGLLRVNSL